MTNQRMDSLSWLCMKVKSMATETINPIENIVTVSYLMYFQ